MALYPGFPRLTRERVSDKINRQFSYALVAQLDSSVRLLSGRSAVRVRPRVPSGKAESLENARLSAFRIFGENRTHSKQRLTSHVFANQRGGVGKCATGCSLGAGLAQGGERLYCWTQISNLLFQNDQNFMPFQKYYWIFLGLSNIIKSV